MVAGAPTTGAAWIRSGGGLGGKHPLYQVLSIMVATFLGAMGLPHVLVRFYTNPDGRAARRTALAVIALLSTVLPVPHPARSVRPVLRAATADHRQGRRRGPAAARRGHRRARRRNCSGALVAAGAIAAFLATSSGLLVSIAGAVSTDLLRGRVRDFRLAAVIGGVIPIPLALAASSFELSRGVGLVFAVAASTLCPLLVLGIWWRGLTAAGAAAGLGRRRGVLGDRHAAGRDRLGQSTTLWAAGRRRWSGYPAAVTVPLAFATMVVVSRLTRATIPADVARVFARMHLPERLGMGVERVPRG